MPISSQRTSRGLDDPARWVDRYGDALFRFALNRVGQRDMAEDLVQEAYLAAWQARDSFDGRSSLGTWLCGILRRKIADYYRRRGRERGVLECESDEEVGTLFSKRGKWLESIAEWKESPEQLAENSEFWAVVVRCLGNLPFHLAEAFQLREMRRASIEEVSALTGITPRNLSVRLHRARLLLRQCLDRNWFRGGK